MTEHEVNKIIAEKVRGWSEGEAFLYNPSQDANQFNEAFVKVSEDVQRRSLEIWASLVAWDVAVTSLPITLIWQLTPTSEKAKYLAMALLGVE